MNWELIRNEIRELRNEVSVIKAKLKLLDMWLPYEETFPKVSKNDAEQKYTNQPTYQLTEDEKRDIITMVDLQDSDKAIENTPRNEG